MKCQLPRQGWIYDYEKKAYILDGIRKCTGENKKYADCYWQRDPRWNLYKKWHSEEEAKNKHIYAAAGKRELTAIEKRSLFVHQELKEFIDECWLHRLSGMWWYNGDKPTYITGVHWYYLSCYWLKSQYPDYKDTDREFFYAWEYADQDPMSLGLIYITKRREGKSYKASVIGVEKVSRRPQFRMGMQSKSKPDAQKLYERAIVAPYKRLPFFFQPRTNIQAGKAPSKLKFETGNMDVDFEDELGSSIDFGPSNAEHYDGEELGYYIDDEFAKLIECNAAERWDIVRFCLTNNTQEIVGKALHISTVEKMGVGEADDFSLINAWKLWQDSDPTELDDNGQTKSGLFRFFTPAHKVGKVDKYGFTNSEAELKKILNKLASITDQYERAAYKRKMPLEIEDAFSMDGANCPFNINLLNDRESGLKILTRLPYEKGNFQWVDGISDTHVEWIPRPDGRFCVFWKPDEARSNLKRERGGEWYPMNTDMGCIGIDPYNHRKVTVDNEKTMSKGAGVGVKFPNAIFPSDCDNGPCFTYMERPAPTVFYEDMLMAAVYYGWSALIEDNKDNCLDYFLDRGYGGYIAWSKPDKRGITNNSQTSGGGVNGQIAMLCDSYISHDINTCYFIDLIRQFIKFDVTKTTKSDLVMAFGYAKMLQKLTMRSIRPRNEKPPKLEQVLPSRMIPRGGRTFFGR